MSHILVVGSSNVDFIMGVHSLPRVGETVNDGVFFQTYGGKGANQAIATARAGAQVTFMTSVGPDRYGDEMIENFRAAGIDPSTIKRSALPSGSALVMFDHRGENYLTVAPGSNFDLMPDDFLASVSAAPSLKTIDLLVLQREIPKKTNETAAAWARENGIPVLFNCAPASPGDVDLLKIADILVVNENEAEALSGISPSDSASAERAAVHLGKYGPREVIITMGKNGAYYRSESLRIHLPSFSVDAVDTTAAGDTFCGYWAAVLAQKGSPDQIIRVASAAAALCVTQKGAQSSIPKMGEVEAFLG
jgi:ribokinase